MRDGPPIQKLYKLVIFAVVVSFGATGAGAQTWYENTWLFDEPANYEYDADLVEVVDGVARLRNLAIDTGLALSLNGSGQHLAIEDAQQQGLNLGTDSFVFAAWIRIESENAFQGIFEKRESTGPYTGLIFHADAKGGGYRLRATISSPTGYAREFLTEIAIRDNNWHQVALAVDRTQLRVTFYLDGSAFGEPKSMVSDPGNIDNPGKFRIGQNIIGAFGGLIDEAYFWRFAAGLPTDIDDIVAAHFYGQVASAQELISKWTFDEATGVDSIGTNHLIAIDAPGYVASQIDRFTNSAPIIHTNCVAGNGDKLYSAAVELGAANQSEIRFQASPDGVTWYYYAAGSGWLVDTGSDVNKANLAHEIRAHLPTFPQPTMTMCMRAFLASNGIQPAVLDEIRILAPPALVEFINPPVATIPRTDGFQILFETDFPVEAYIEHRSANTAWISSILAGPGIVMRNDISGLAAGMEYEYRVSYRPWGTNQPYQVTIPAYVSTPPPDTEPGQTRFVVWGDSRPATGVPAQPEAFNQLVQMIATDNAAMHISIGDSVNLSGAMPFLETQAIELYTGWRASYALAGGSGYMLFGLGNHEGETLDEPFRSRAMRARLRATAQSASADPAERFFAWRWGDALFVMMNGSSQSLSAAEENWLTQTLEQQAAWKFVFTHYPIFNSDRNRGPILATRLHNIFLANGVQIVFQAHDHWYADFIKDGIHYTTSGGAGSPLREAGFAFNEISEHHYLRAELAPTAITISAVRVSTDQNGDDLLDSYCVQTPDASPLDSDMDGTADVCDLDDDADSIADRIDNCINAANGPTIPDAGGNSQLDTDGDGYGNLCDADLNNDGVVNFSDLAMFRTAFGTTNPDADFNGDGIVNFADLASMRLRFGKPPGPSGVNP